jgi:hypothetical protein
VVYIHVYNFFVAWSNKSSTSNDLFPQQLLWVIEIEYILYMLNHSTQRLSRNILTLRNRLLVVGTSNDKDLILEMHDFLGYVEIKSITI